jgi:rhamnogalacturonyl hydrolase YesR
MPNKSPITQAEKNEALRIAKSTPTSLSDTNEANAILAGLVQAKDQGIVNDTPEQTARKAAAGVIGYLKDNNLSLPDNERSLLVTRAKAFAVDIIQSR